MNIGNPIEHPQFWQDVLQIDHTCQPYGDPLSYVGGTVQNFVDLNRRRYAVWTNSEAPHTEIVFPGITVSDSLVLSGRGYTLPGDFNPPPNWDPTATIRMSTSGNMTLATLQHEYGHFLQIKIFGHSFFMYKIFPTSAWSCAFNSSVKHNLKWTETGASALAKIFFGPNSKIAHSKTYTSTSCQ